MRSRFRSPPLPVRGVCPVVETPFTASGDLDEDGFIRVIDHVVEAGVAGVMFPGFASEYLALTDGERDHLCRLLLDRTAGLPAFTRIISIPDHATLVAVARARTAIEMGADAINLLPPHQLSPSADAVREHILAVAAAVAPRPVILQYAPALTGTALNARAISDLASVATNLTEVKVESTPPGSLIAALAAQSPALPAAVGYAGVQMIDAFRRGAVGVQPGCSFVEIYQRIWQLWQRGDTAGAAALHTRLLPYISYWMQGVDLMVAAEKMIGWRRGWTASDHCRAPSRRLDAEERTMVDNFLEEFEDLLSIDPRRGAA
ncbi:MAG: 4-hydroxy-tetrahydrodipicolinate synthase, partial [Microbacteriaceae bacterium]|nr:4-hydroxy-tetrahydrodipicolinate synthase [Microbacteriaceae bacterium]